MADRDQACTLDRDGFINFLHFTHDRQPAELLGSSPETQERFGPAIDVIVYSCLTTAERELRQNKRRYSCLIFSTTHQDCNYQRKPDRLFVLSSAQAKTCHLELCKLFN